MDIACRTVREVCLIKFNEANSRLKLDGALACARAKTSKQLKRNGPLVHVCETLKKDARYKNRKVEICWKKNDSKDKHTYNK